MPFKDICVEFTNGEWALLSEEQRGLYRDVMLENFRNVSAMGELGLLAGPLLRFSWWPGQGRLLPSSVANISTNYNE